MRSPTCREWRRPRPRGIRLEGDEFHLGGHITSWSSNEMHVGSFNWPTRAPSAPLTTPAPAWTTWSLEASMSQVMPVAEFVGDYRGLQPRPPVRRRERKSRWAERVQGLRQGGAPARHRRRARRRLQPPWSERSGPVAVRRVVRRTARAGSTSTNDDRSNHPGRHLVPTMAGHRCATCRATTRCRGYGTITSTACATT